MNRGQEIEATLQLDTKCWLKERSQRAYIRDCERQRVRENESSHTSYYVCVYVDIV